MFWPGCISAASALFGFLDILKLLVGSMIVSWPSPPFFQGTEKLGKSKKERNFTAERSLIDMYLSDSKFVTPNLKDFGSTAKAVNLMTSWEVKGFFCCIGNFRDFVFFLFDFEFLIFSGFLNRERFTFISFEIK